MKHAIERSITSLGMRCYASPWITLCGVVLVVAALASQLPKTDFLSDVDRYLAPSDPIRIQYDLLREQFGRDDMLLISVTPAEVFDARFLETLREIHKDFENDLPWVDEVQSLINARQTRGEDDALIVGELLEDWPETPDEIARIQEIARANPLYRDLYLSADGRTAGIIVRPLTFQPSEVESLEGFDSADSVSASATKGASDVAFLDDAQTAEIVRAIRVYIESRQGEGLEMHVTGSPAVNYEIQQQTAADMARFSMLSLLAIALLLWVVFRRVIGVILPLAIVSAAVVSTLGAMAATGRPLTFVSQIVPSFILAVGVGFAVHVLSIFFQRLDAEETKEASVGGALRHSGPAIAMSALTTAGGMLSFVPTGLLPVRDIGLFVPLGVLIAAILALTALPAVLALVPVRGRPIVERRGAHLTEDVLVACGRFGTRHPVFVTLTSLAVFAACASGIPLITEDYDPLEWLPEDNVARVSTSYIDRTMGGASGLELIFDSGRENGLYDPETLRRIERIQRYAEATRTSGIVITKTTSIVDIVKEIHQALHGGDPDQHVIADDPLLIAQELLLFENSGSDDLEDVVDSQFRLARISLKAPQVGAGHQRRFLNEHTEPMRELAGDADLQFTGFFGLASQVVILTADTAIRSYGIAFMLITPLMMLFIGSLRTGIVSMAPNLMPILMVLGVMGWAGVALDTISVLIGGIALGLVVDDTIHILHGFRREYEATGDVEEATVRTMRTTGRALFFTTVVLTSAFSIYGLASAGTVSNFGRLTALAVGLAFLFDIFLSPALLALVYRKR